MGAYDRDFHAWAMEQAELLRSRSANAIDRANLAEEIESLGAPTAFGSARPNGGSASASVEVAPTIRTAKPELAIHDRRAA